MVFAVLFVLVLLAIADLTSPNSILRGFFGATTPATRQQQSIESLRQRGIPVPDRTGLLIPGEATSTTSALPA